MILKYYGEVNDLKEAINYYSQIFDLQVIKDHTNGHHVNLRLFGQITLMLHEERMFIKKSGYLVIKFEDDEVKNYKDAVKRVRESSLTKISYDEFDAKWGTTFFEFTDQYGYAWDFEINTKALKSTL